MSFKYTVDSTGLKRKITKLRSRFDESELLEGVANRQLAWVQRNFIKEGGMEGIPWRPLKPATIRRRRGKGKHLSRILQDTGALRKSFDAYGAQIKGSVVHIGTEKEYAGTHEFGNPNKNIPQRKMLPTHRTAKKLGISFLEAMLKNARY